MADRLIFPLTFLAALGSGLVAGVFFAFSSFVMGALGRLAPPQGISAMQSINIVVVNPVFFSVFFGTAFLCCILAVASCAKWTELAFACVLAGSLIYLAGSIGVTLACNVPLNDALAAVKPDSADGAALWTQYLTRWTSWNHIRGAASLVSSACFIAALRGLA